MEKFITNAKVVVVKTREEGGALSEEYKKGDKAVYIGGDTFKMFDGCIQLNYQMDCFKKEGQ